MKKTGYEIIGMIKDGKAPKKIKLLENNTIWDFIEDTKTFTIDLVYRMNDEFEIIEEPKVWEPKQGETYWSISLSEGVENYQYNGDGFDKGIQVIGNCFKTKKEAEKYLEKLKIYTQLKRYAEEHNTEKIDWNNSQESKWHITYYTHCNSVETVNTYTNKETGQIYFTSKVICERAIEHIGEDNIRKLFE